MDSIEFDCGWNGLVVCCVMWESEACTVIAQIPFFCFSARGSEYTRDTLPFSVSANCTQLEFTDLLGAGYIFTREFLCFYVFSSSNASYLVKPELRYKL